MRGFCAPTKNLFFLQQNDFCSNKVKEENLKLKSENGVLGQYIENLMQV